MITAILFIFYVEKPMESLQNEVTFNSIEECQAAVEPDVFTILERAEELQIVGVQYICGELKEFEL